MFVHWIKKKKKNSTSVGVLIALFPVFISFSQRTSKRTSQIIVREQSVEMCQMK